MQLRRISGVARGLVAVAAALVLLAPRVQAQEVVADLPDGAFPVIVPADTMPTVSSEHVAPVVICPLPQVCTLFDPCESDASVI
jgi:hypothetical protein